MTGFSGLVPQIRTAILILGNIRRLLVWAAASNHVEPIGSPTEIIAPIRPARQLNSIAPWPTPRLRLHLSRYAPHDSHFQRHIRSKSAGTPQPVATDATIRAAVARRKDPSKPGAFVCELCKHNFTTKHNYKSMLLATPPLIYH
jgi:hypothetical protein